MPSSAETAPRPSEPALEPDLPICDPHMHLWMHRGRYLASDFIKDVTASGQKVVSSIFVACEAMYRDSGPEELRPVGETEFVESQANGPEAAAAPLKIAEGVVGYADLGLGGRVTEVLQAHIRASPTRFRGVRFQLAWDPNAEIRGKDSREGWTRDAAFRAGYAMLGRHGLCFDAWAFHPQLHEVAALAGDFPDIPLILNHAGGPLGTGPYKGKHDAVFSAWSAGMKALARHPNVFVKLGGFGMPRIGFPWHSEGGNPSSEVIAAGLAPYVDFCIDLFGPPRCMFESNFPSDKVSFSFGNIWNAFKRLTRDLGGADRDLLFGGTARNVYRLAAD